jgi:hypothetical protein
VIRHPKWHERLLARWREAATGWLRPA